METEKETSSLARSSRSPLALLGILVSSIAIIKWIRSKSKSPARKPTDCIDSYANTYKPATEPEKIMPMGADVANPHNPASVHPCCHSEKKRKRGYKWWKGLGLAINFLTLIAVVWYACITRNIWQQMIEADRPWVGGAEPWLHITPNQEVMNQGQKQIRSNVDVFIRNAGKSPAYIEATSAGWRVYNSFPESPEIIPCSLISVPETKTLIPGQQAGFTFVYIGHTEMTRDLYAFADIEYRDIRTQKRYHSHFCKQYDPATLGWKLCETYNDAN